MPVDRTDPTVIDPQLDRVSSSLFRVAVKAVIIEDKKILLVKETDDDWWSMPGGGILHRETPQEALTRELKEELGLEPAGFAIGDLLLATSDSVVDGIPKANVYYRVRLHSKQFRRMPDVQEIRWYTATEMADVYLSPSGGEANKLLPRLLS